MLTELLSNRIILSGLIGWASAQILKTIIYALVNRKLDLTRLVGDGGMPSAHSSTVVSVTVDRGQRRCCNRVRVRIVLTSFRPVCVLCLYNHARRFRRTSRDRKAGQGNQ